MIDQFIEVVLSEYGAFTFFLFLTDIILLGMLRILWKQNVSLGDKLMGTVDNNTKVLTQIVEKLENNES